MGIQSVTPSFPLFPKVRDTQTLSIKGDFTALWSNHTRSQCNHSPTSTGGQPWFAYHQGRELTLHPSVATLLCAYRSALTSPAPRFVFFRLSPSALSRFQALLTPLPYPCVVASAEYTRWPMFLQVRPRTGHRARVWPPQRGHLPCSGHQASVSAVSGSLGFLEAVTHFDFGKSPRAHVASVALNLIRVKLTI